MLVSLFQVCCLLVNLVLIFVVSFLLFVCDYISSFFKFKQILEEVKVEGIVLGVGCCQVGQSLEDCYQCNFDVLKVGIFIGWKDMYEYMVVKGIQIVILFVFVVDVVKDDVKFKDGKDGKDKDVKDSDCSCVCECDVNCDNVCLCDCESFLFLCDSGSDCCVSCEEKMLFKY